MQAKRDAESRFATSIRDSTAYPPSFHKSKIPHKISLEIFVE
jgi:hypothetical protein